MFASFLFRVAPLAQVDARGVLRACLRVFVSPWWDKQRQRKLTAIRQAIPKAIRLDT